MFKWLINTMPRLLISEQGKNLTPYIRCSAPPSTLHLHLYNICNTELVSYIYNVSRLMLTINVLLLLIASVRIGQSVLLCLYWFKGFRFRRDGGLAHTYAHTLVLREPHEESPLTGLPPCFVTARTLINISAPALLC